MDRLSAAVEEASLERVRESLPLVADVDATTGGGYTCLIRAAALGNADIVGALLTAGASPNLASRRMNKTAVYAAADAGHAAVVRVLAASGANLDHVRFGGWTALHIAAHNGHVDCVRVLVEGGADALQERIGGMTPLHSAAKAGHPGCIEALLRASPPPPVEKEDDFGCTALAYALSGEHTWSAVGALRRAGATGACGARGRQYGIPEALAQYREWCARRREERYALLCAVQRTRVLSAYLARDVARFL